MQAIAKNTLKKGIFLFLFFTIAGLTLLFFYTQTPETFHALHRLKFHFIMIAMVLCFLDMWLGAWRYHIFVRKMQTLILFVLYFAPTPGGGGIAEFSIAALMSLVMPSYLLTVFTVLYRFFILYVPVTLGSFVLMSELRSEVKNDGKI